MQNRLASWTCKMQQRGINNSPIQPGLCNNPNVTAVDNSDDFTSGEYAQGFINATIVLAATQVATIVIGVILITYFRNKYLNAVKLITCN